MGTFNRFEDSTIWQRARGACKDIYSVSMGGEFKQDRGLREQIQRAAVSVMANVAEGAGRGSTESSFSSWS